MKANTALVFVALFAFASMACIAIFAPGWWKLLIVFPAGISYSSGHQPKDKEKEGDDEEDDAQS